MFPRSENFLSLGLETLVFVFASSFVLGEGLIFEENPPTSALSALRAPRTALVRRRVRGCVCASPLPLPVRTTENLAPSLFDNQIFCPDVIPFPHPIFGGVGIPSRPVQSSPVIRSGRNTFDSNSPDHRAWRRTSSLPRAHGTDVLLCALFPLLLLSLHFC